MKVFSGLKFAKGKQRRTVVAAPSRKAAAELLGLSVGHMKDYWTVTGNQLEIETAMAQPGVVFMSSGPQCKEFKPVSKGPADAAPADSNGGGNDA